MQGKIWLEGAIPFLLSLRIDPCLRLRGFTLASSVSSAISNVHLSTAVAQHMIMESPVVDNIVWHGPVPQATTGEEEVTSNRNYFCLWYGLPPPS